ncbi:site-specific integrase [Victivallis sp. Marseille-Q1083]|uniref:site-specific integrase n=1 Tax=Victivallis sp. Marseille-Q1083 TaxID=2717288 RepID=UPI001588741D|nr:site-specific integrase [Victivallis sp. Marseille-Q1083]
MAGMKRLELPEIARRMKQMPLKYAAIVAIGVPTGCRISEILPLRRRDLIEYESIREVVSFEKLKARDGDNCRKMTIPGVFRATLVRWLNHEADRGYCRPDDYVFRGQAGDHLSRFTCYNYFRSILGRGYGTHWMRKTFAWEIFRYYLKQSAADPIRALELTRQALGHARIDTTIKYLGIAEEALYEAQNAIFADIETEEEHGQ